MKSNIMHENLFVGGRRNTETRATQYLCNSAEKPIAEEAYEKAKAGDLANGMILLGQLDGGANGICSMCLIEKYLESGLEMVLPTCVGASVPQPRPAPQQPPAMNTQEKPFCSELMGLLGTNDEKISFCNQLATDSDGSIVRQSNLCPVSCANLGNLSCIDRFPRGCLTDPALSCEIPSVKNYTCCATCDGTPGGVSY